MEFQFNRFGFFLKFKFHSPFQLLVRTIHVLSGLYEKPLRSALCQVGELPLQSGVGVATGPSITDVITGNIGKFATVSGEAAEPGLPFLNTESDTVKESEEEEEELLGQGSHGGASFARPGPHRPRRRRPAIRVRQPSLARSKMYRSFPSS